MPTSLQSNGATLGFYHWPVSDARAVVQISHGMAEHLQRYDSLAKHLNSLGIAVVGADHRGHGQSHVVSEPLGYFGDNATWATIVDDLHAVRHHAESLYPELPYFFVGHSMGSLLLRAYLKKYSKGLAGAAIIGTGLWPSVIGEGGLALAKVLTRVAPLKEGKLLSSLSFGSYNKKFGNRTKFEWLSRNSQEVDAYVADPLCGYNPPNAFFVEILGGLKSVNTDDNYELRTAVPLFIASGEVDPFGGATAVHKIARNYAVHGQRDIETHVYPQARHEIFNEINHEEVFSDLGEWLTHHI
ncbi:alpha/beta fold hydrolase [Arcanobacterium ihumii]|uniref:alpha/beta fold hydrolase n=1 Tax=Arcanobacterium ihumii TaxID=2138162 RepID=UPI000F52C72E|nr:alpha/beta fold hydrolase [Arcanobacterium ihumii]